MLRIFCCCLLLLLYWAIVVHFLRASSPVFVDGGGPMPSFQWGRLPQPNLGEYTRRQNHYDLIYSLPYYFAGLLLTGIGCGVTPLILRRLRTSPSHVFRNAVVATLAQLLLLALVSDVGTLLGAWRGPVFLLDRYHEIWALCQAFLPACVLSGVVAVGKRWISAHLFRPIRAN
jgi:hypothetical protein